MAAIYERGLWQTGFLLFKELYNIAEYLYCYLDSIRCSLIIIFLIECFFHIKMVTRLARTLARMTRTARIVTRMARIVTRMARWLAY